MIHPTRAPAPRWTNKSRLTPAGQLSQAPELRTLAEAKAQSPKLMTREQVIFHDPESNPHAR